MKASEANLLRFLEGPKQFQVPIFQRRYSWKKEDCEKLWNDVLRTGQNEDIPSYFLGSIVSMQYGLHDTSGIIQLVLIDGQQRLTTLSLLLAALGRAIEAKNIDICVDRSQLERDYLFNDKGEGELRYKQLLTKHDKETLIQLLEVGKAADNTALLVENYQFFANQLKRADLQAVYEGIQKLEIVDIALKHNHDNPQLIFESLNSKGVKLSPADLIRNYVLMEQEPDFQSRLYETYWYPMEQRFEKEYTKQFDRFIESYLTLKLGVIGLSTRNKEGVYESFKKYVNDKKHPEALEETIAEIDHYSEHYVRIVMLQEEDSDIQTCFEDIQALGGIPGINIEVVFPFLLAVYEAYIQRQIEKAEMIEILRLTESYIFRRIVCDVASRDLNQLFAVLAVAALAAGVGKSNCLQSLTILLPRLTDTQCFPSDCDFKQEFLTKKVYKPDTPNYLCNYLLRKLEKYEHKEPISVEGYTIEHIMPQTLSDSEEWKEELGENWENVYKDYLHTIGNLTLTKHNSRLSNRPFKEKRDMPGGYRNSSLHLDQSLAHAERWDEDAIVNRANELFQTALKIWIGVDDPDTLTA